MCPVAEGERDETTEPGPLLPNPVRPLLRGQTQDLARRLAAVSGPLPDHVPHLLAGDPDRLTEEEVRIEAAEAGVEEEVRTAHSAGDPPLLRDPPPRALQGHLNEELPQSPLAHLLRSDLDGLGATLVLCLGHRPGQIVEHLVGEYLAAERGLEQHQRQTLRRTPLAHVLEVVNVG
jgi:hypothetical protein